MDNNKWVNEIVGLQQHNGSWGSFHTMFGSQKCQPEHITTEQALWRLHILGMTANDKPIKRALKYMEAHLRLPFPTIYHEQKHDSKTYGDLMLAAWIHLFEPENEAALVIAKKWANIINAAFHGGALAYENYVAAFEAEFIKLNRKAQCLADFNVFYQLSLLPGLLESKAESAMLDYILSHPRGIVYIYNKPLHILPEAFASRKASQYLAALEVLAGYELAPAKLAFAVQWLREYQDENGQWDFGSKAKDGVYFPLSNAWSIDRKQDCTMRVERLLDRLQS